MNLRDVEQKQSKEEQNMKESYQQTIELLMASDIDYKKVVIKLAQLDPDMFIKCANGSISDIPAINGMTRERVNEVREIVNSGKRIDAIKKVREYTKWGLKEAKEYVDRM